MSNFSRDSHFVPQATLRRWSQDGRQIQTYQLLVPHSGVPVWRLRSIKGIALQRDLYTTFSGGKELDSFEHWIAKEFEEPGLEAVNKLISYSRLKPSDWKNLVLFVAAQDVRTPLNFMESMQRWGQEMPSIIQSSLKESIEKLQNAEEEGLMIQAEEHNNAFTDLTKIKIQPPIDQNSDQSTIRAEVILGRNFWIASMRHLLTGAANILCKHRWSVVEPYENEEWPLTDHPVIRLNYFGPGNFDFCGGWNKPGSELMMPVSPRHLLYVQVGKKVKNRFTFEYKETRLLQEIIVKRAHRWIFSKNLAPWIEKVRPREVNQEKFKEEQEAWEDWHKQQMGAESS